MTNPSKAKGTRAETAVTQLARGSGFPLAERIALHGSNDHGDIRLAPGLILEVKAGKAAQTASLGQIGAWLGEASREAVNDHATSYGLVVQRQGFGIERVHLWEAWLADKEIIAGDAEAWHGHRVSVLMVTLQEALRYWRADGYGDPL